MEAGTERELVSAMPTPTDTEAARAMVSIHAGVDRALNAIWQRKRRAKCMVTKIRLTHLADNILKTYRK